MQWFKWLRTFEIDRDSIKTKNFIVQSNVAYSYTKNEVFKIKDATVYVTDNKNAIIKTSTQSL